MDRVRGTIAAGVLVLMGALLVVTSLHKRLSYDELDNLAYGHRFLTRGPGAEMRGQRMPVLALSALPCLADGCRGRTLDGSEGRRLLVRAPTMLFALATAALAAWWAASLFGANAGLLALLLTALNPNLLAHGKQVTSDVATTFFTLLAAWALWRCLRRFTWGALFGCAAAVAGALASKFTSLLLLPMVAAVAGVHAWRAGTPWRTAFLRAVAFGATVLALLNAVYLFDGTFGTLRDLRPQSRALAPLAGLPIPVPLPRVFAQGLDYSSAVQETAELGRGANYVLGQRNHDGRWYAFPLMLLLKTPLALFALLALAGLRRLRDAAEAATTLFAFPTALLAFFSLAVDVQIGLRYVLPVVPFLAVLAAPAANQQGRRRTATMALAAWYAASSLSYLPHPMAYFNELIGRRVGAYRFLADSNLDWEDHRHWIDAWRRRYAERRAVVSPEGPTTGWVIVGANELVGIFDAERYRWLREGPPPVDHIAYAHLVFFVRPEDLPPAR